MVPLNVQTDKRRLCKEVNDLIDMRQAVASTCAKNSELSDQLSPKFRTEGHRRSDRAGVVLAKPLF